MILTNIKDCSRYEGLHPRFKELFDYIKSHDILNMPLGRIEIDGDNLFINNVEPEGVEASTQPMELHQTYIDVHMLFSGDETMAWLPADSIHNYTKVYDAEDDCALTMDKPSSYVTLSPNDMVIVYPEDAHAPVIGKGKIRKLIAKIRL